MFNCIRLFCPPKPSDANVSDPLSHVLAGVPKTLHSTVHATSNSIECTAQAKSECSRFEASLYSVKLTRMPISTLKASATSLANDLLSVKIKYHRTESPTADNPLNGLFNYTPFTDKLPTLLSSKVLFSLHDFSEKAKEPLLGALKDQNIRHGKYKIQKKSLRSLQEVAAFKKIRDGDVILYRVEGAAANVLINHGHFLESQKNSQTGISTENLGWVIKLKGHVSTKNIDVAAEIFDDSKFLAGVNQCVYDGLKQGVALELVNDKIKELLQTQMKERGIGACEAKFALKRSGLIANTQIVIGEKTVLPGASQFIHTVTAAEAIDTKSLISDSSTRKYIDFSF